MNYHDLYIAYLYYFNVDVDYFECHEVMEELWLEQGRNPLWQGLLQVAVGLYHHDNDNISGAIKLFEQSLEKLRAKSDVETGIDLEKVIRDTEEYVTTLRQNHQMAFQPFLISILDPTLEQLAQAYVPHHD
jgi:predicted metal-dependent hydrolase